MRQRQFVFLIVMVAVAANALGYVLFRARRPPPPPPPPSNTTLAVTPAPKTPEDAERETRGRTLREAGYQALLEGDYDKALIQLTEARSNLAEKSSVDDLLRVTEQLRAKTQAQTRGAAPEERSDVDAKENPRQPKGKPARRATPARGTEREVIHPEASRTESPRVIKAEPVTTASPPATPTGLLLVTSTPRGLLVHVDGVAMDLTPMRSSVSAGSHRVALYDGDRKLFETPIEVTVSQPTTVVKDLTFELAAPGVATVAPERGPVPEPTPPPPAPDRQPVATPVAPPSSSGSGKGGLEITSPGLYAEVWVNGRPYGFPPAKVEDLPAGSAEVEIRINGVVKRAKTVNVEAGKVTAVKITR